MDHNFMLLQITKLYAFGNLVCQLAPEKNNVYTDGRLQKTTRKS